MIEARDFSVEGSPVACDVYSPDAPSMASVVIVHGLAEHSARYAPLAEALVARGWTVFAYDQRGHGRTALREEDLGLFAETEGWDRVVEDLRKVVDAAKAAAPEAPLAVVAHSMGSLVLQDYLARYKGAGLDAAVLSGTSGPPPAIATLGRYVARFERWRQGARGKSSLIDKLAFGAYNGAFKPARTDFDWLSRDPAQVDLYVEDPKCGFLSSNQLWIDLLDAVPNLAKPDRLARFRRDLPIYVFSGDQDPVSEGGKTVKALVELYKKAELDVELKLYPEGRHEMLNETNRADVHHDLTRWLSKHLPTKAA